MFFVTMLLLNWNPRLTFTDTRKKIWIRGVVYEITDTITNPLKTITGPLKNKNAQYRPKKGPKQKKILARFSRNFLREISLHNPFKVNLQIKISFIKIIRNKF